MHAPVAVIEQALARYRPWLWAAAVYNLVWGTLVVLFPNLLFDLIGMRRPETPALWQVVGMFVLVYAPAYAWAARRPARHPHLVLIGLLGKLLGPLGFVWSAATPILLGQAGALPLAFGLILLTNDLLWWPAFALYLRDAARLGGGWAALLRGD